MGWSQDELIMFLRACLAFWMLPRSGFRFRRKTSSCCCPAHSPRTHSRFTWRKQQRDSYGNATIRYIVQAYKQASAAKHLDDSEAKETFVQHDDLVLVTSVIHNVAESKQRRHVGQDSAAPHRVAFVRDKHLLFISSDGIVQHDGVLILIRRGEVILWSKQEKKNWLKRIK